MLKPKEQSPMSTSAQQIANTANAQRSTGPVSPAGKARSAMNSHVHGLCAKHILVGSEDKPEYVRMAGNYFIELHPNGEIEQTLFDEVIGAAWQLSRLRRMETEACAGKTTYTGMLDDEALQKKLDRLARHHTRIERTFHRCFKGLKTLQAERLKEEAMFTPTVKPESIDQQLQRLNLSALAAISQRSQSPAPADESGILTPAELAEIDRDFDRLEEQNAAALRKRERPAA